MVMTTAMLCTALNIYWESRSEPLHGQHAVAQVTFNRAQRDPSKVCKVVFEPKQFSWANKSDGTQGQGEGNACQEVPAQREQGHGSLRAASLSIPSRATYGT